MHFWVFGSLWLGSQVWKKDAESRSVWAEIAHGHAQNTDKNQLQLSTMLLCHKHGFLQEITKQGILLFSMRWRCAGLSLWSH